MPDITYEADLEIRCLLADARYTTCPFREALIKYFEYSNLDKTCPYRKMVRLLFKEVLKKKCAADYDEQMYDE